MFIHGLARLAVVPLVGAAGLVAPVAPAGAEPVAGPAVTSGSDLYVGGTAATCSRSGNGSVEAPFCTISAAAAVAEPGQTVWIQAGNYPEKVELTRSGAESAPITFRAVNGPSSTVRVGNFGWSTWTGSPLSLTAVHDVVVEGLTLFPAGADAVQVDGSSRVTLDGIAARTGSRAGVRVSGGSRDVTVSRGWFAGQGGVGVSVEAGVTGTVVTASTFHRSSLAITDASGSTITGNTVVTDCTPGILVAGASPGVAVRNNVVRTGGGAVSDPQRCADPATATAITVSAASAPGSAAGHNLIDPASAGPLYSWAGSDYADLPAFVATTGQGGGDLAAPALLQDQQGTERGWFPLGAASPAVDSADPAAAGATPSDLLGNAHADSPSAPNTGGGYRDRGAVELQGKLSVTGNEIRRRVGGNPFDVTTPIAVRSEWPTDGPVGTVARRWSDERFFRTGPIAPADHRFRRAGAACVINELSWNGFRAPNQFTSNGPCTVIGARYTPVAPTRVLDTRAAIGIGTRLPLAGNSELVLPLPSIDGVSAADITAVVLNLTVTQPTTAGVLRIWPDGTPLPEVSNVNFVAGETVPNLVTVPMSNGNLRIRNTGGGTVHVIADLQGFYSAAGSGFKVGQPVRVLDTRNAGFSAFPPNTTRALDLSGRIPTGATAVVLNVTVTRPAAAGVLTVFPYGSALPTASNLNFVAGQTIPNLVMVPVVNGRVAIHNFSSGSTHVVVDLSGWFGGGASDVFVPYGPRRTLDTRLGGAISALAPNTNGSVLVFYVDPTGNDTTPRPTALVANVTATQPTRAGALAFRPSDADQAGTSNVNFAVGETAANMVIVGVGPDGQAVSFNDSLGYTHMIIDQSGHFIAAAS
ncbi:right-handed parallel beta-helix repeat-containing protein [Micromonospora sp. CPCC 205711]|uniref:right-handed parallel beta-helix repeat-containing protein n=1 Tax=Micromonospora sp. CPCC 205547 TaxID=3122400 RepID=UPI002FF20E11